MVFPKYSIIFYKLITFVVPSLYFLKSEIYYLMLLITPINFAALIRSPHSQFSNTTFHTNEHTTTYSLP